MNRKYGHIRDDHDSRDYKFAAPEDMALPSSIDLRKDCPMVYDQGELGSCSGNAIAGAIQFEMIKRKQSDLKIPSRLFIYYNERVIEGTVGQDSGAQMRDGMKTISKQGVCDGNLCPYIITNFANKPSDRAYKAALNNVISSYESVEQSEQGLKGALVSGYPVVFGFQVYSAFESSQVSQDGIVPLPQQGEEYLGGHAVMLVGYDDSKQWFVVRNSWGPHWGKGGYFFLPYEYVLNQDLASDFWVIKM